jgi:hydroxypyruvate reductase
MSAEFHAKKLGYHTVVDNRCDDWGYADAARYLLDRIRVLRAPYDRVCVLSTGEVTVAVPNDLSAERKGPPGETHLGGRNQHFALFAATLLTPSDKSVCVLSAGSDGIDGNSDAAGGIIGNRTLEDARQLEDAKLALSAFDSFTFLHSLGATVVTGTTGNNLRDLRVLLAERTAD